jgi:thioredoxin
MKKITGLMLLMLSVLLASCTAQAKSDKTEKLETPKAESAEVINLTKADFISKVFDYEKNATEWKYKGDKPCIVDFYADWCGPCKKVGPILKELAKEYDGKLVIYKINVDKEKELASAFGIQSIPTLLFIPVEGTPQVAMGALSKEQFQETINDFLLKTKE